MSVFGINASLIKQFASFRILAVVPCSVATLSKVSPILTTYATHPLGGGQDVGGRRVAVADGDATPVTEGSKLGVEVDPASRVGRLVSVVVGDGCFIPSSANAAESPPKTSKREIAAKRTLTPSFRRFSIFSP
jgi:hypothetical protein